MGKRFGRNQKRRLREEIKRIEESRNNWKRRHDEVKMLAARDRSIVEETAATLGRHFVTLDPETIEVQSIDHIASGWRKAVIGGLNNRATWDYSSTIRPLEFMEKVIPVLHGGKVADELRNESHIVFKYDGLKVGYAISKNALGMLPKAVAGRRIAEEMAEHLMGLLS